MKTEAVVVGVGPLDRWARRTAERFQLLNGIPTRVVGREDLRFLNCSRPHWGKAFAWRFVAEDVERVVVLDADLVPVRPLPALPEAPFAAMCSELTTLRPGFLASRFPFLHPRYESWYFSAGLMIGTRESVKAFDLTQEFMRATREKTWPMVDNSWFNLAVLVTFGDYHRLPQEWNWRTSRFGNDIHSDTLMLHCVGKGMRSKLDLLAATWREVDSGRHG